MLAIRSSQMQELALPNRRQFEIELLTHLSAGFHIDEVNRQAALQAIRNGIARAEQYGVVKAWDVRRFVEFVFEYGPDFDLKEWALPILRTPFSGTQKMDKIDYHTTFVLREARHAG